MVIGISGKLGSGKDTVGQIIQWLTYEDVKNPIDPPITFKEWVKANDFEFNEHGEWKIKKMAGKLKEIASVILGVPVEKFEDRAFKDSKLGPEWGYIMREDGRIYSPDEYPDEEYTEMTVREFLQKLGTDAMRNGLHPNTWANAFWSDYKIPSIPNNIKGIGPRLEWLINNSPNWIITDIRFPNEAQSVLDFTEKTDLRAILIRVNRDGNTGNHPSETALDDWKDWDYVIDNNGTIEELIEKVREILTLEGIL